MSRSPMRSQQASWHAATKRHIMKAWGEDHNDSTNIDGGNPAHVRSLQKDLTAKFQHILHNLKADCEDAKIQQEEALNVGLVKLPKAIRQMTVEEFNQLHQCDLLALLKSKDGVVLSSSSSSSSSAAVGMTANHGNGGVGKKREYHHTVAATPAPRSRANPTAPGSVARTVRKGEGIFSANGSPVETHEVGSVVATVTKKRRGKEDEGNGAAANFEINVGEGRVINLNDPTGLNALDSDMKATAASQLKVLQDQMASLMAQLTKGE